MILISVVIRTLNEATYLPELLQILRTQKLLPGWRVEVVLVDSGSTDGTLRIAAENDCRILHISEAEFSFGRSLNRGCDHAEGNILVFVSGHCLPVDDMWLDHLISPLIAGTCCYSYGRQIGAGTTRYSENQVFQKYYPPQSLLPQSGFFANNANAALLKDVWSKYRFDERLTGLEDMHLAKRLVADGYRIGYAADACVHHIHQESWTQVLHRYEREGAALADIMPESGLNLLHFLRYTAMGVIEDSRNALREGVLSRELTGILLFRILQYWGSYRGTRFARALASMRRKTYFHPNRRLESSSQPDRHSSDLPPQTAEPPGTGA